MDSIAGNANAFKVPAPPRPPTVARGDNADDADIFKVPAPPRPPCDDGTSSMVQRQQSRGVSKKRLRSRAKSRAKSRSHSRPSSHLRNAVPMPASETNIDLMDADLNDINAELDGIEQRTNQILTSVQKEIATCSNYMLDTIMAGITNGVDAIRGKLPEINKMRQANRSVKSQLRALDDLDNL